MSGGTINLISTNGAANAITNNATLSAANGGTLLLGQGNGTGNITNTGSGNITVADNSSAIVQNGIEITGGTINGLSSFVSGKGFSASNNGNNFLSGVTINGVLDLASNTSEERTINGLTLNGTASINNNSLLTFEGDQTLTGTGDVLFGSTGSSNRLTIEGNSTLTIDTGIMLHGQNGTIGGQAITGGTNALVNNGTIAADVSGGTLNIAANNFSNGSSGTLETQTGAGIAISTANTPTNAGTVKVAPNSTISTSGDLAQTAGSTQVDGTLALNSGNNTFNVQGGLVFGSGTIRGNVNNAGNVRPGDSPGLLKVTGNYTQTSLGTFDVELGGHTVGINYSHLTVGGNATLDGTLDVSLINNFQPQVGDQFNILDYGGTRTGTFATLASLPSGLGYNVLYQDSLQDIVITITKVPPPVPGPDSLLVLGLGLGGVVMRLRRRRVNA